MHLNTRKTKRWTSDKDGQVFWPAQGIPHRSRHPLYLSALDKAFKNESFCSKAKKRLFTILKDLKLQVSPHKTRMGQLKQGFHFLGVEFVVARTPQNKTQAKPTIHTRSCRRALDRVQAMRSDAAHPVKLYPTRHCEPKAKQSPMHTRGLLRLRLAMTARSTTPTCSRHPELIQKWVNQTMAHGPPDIWIGRGLIHLT